MFAGAARHLVQHFKRSSKAAQALRALQQSDGKALEVVLDVLTRWNSTFFMLSRLCELQHYIRQILCDENITRRNEAAHLELKDEHWRLIQNLIQVLKPTKVEYAFCHIYFLSSTVFLVLQAK